MRKERYFTEESLQEKSKELLATVENLRRRHQNIRFQPEKAALLVLDLQEYFLQAESHAFVPSAPAILPGIKRLIDAFVQANQLVVVTRHTNTPEDAGMMATWWRDLINLQTSRSHNITLLQNPNYKLVNKKQYDAFHATELEKTLYAHGATQVVICGVMTHLCCETTARSAFVRGFEVFFTIDGTATYNEELHRASLLTLSHGFAVPVLIEELLLAMETHEP